MSRIIKSTVTQRHEDNRKVIGLKSVKPIAEPSSAGEHSFQGPSGAEVLEDAKNEARQIIQAAENQSREMKEQLALEREQWVIEREQLMQEAYNAGFLQGEEEGRNKGYGEYHQRLLEANEINERNKQLYEDYIQRAEKVILNLGIACAEKIINQQLEENPGQFLSIVERGLKEVRDLPHIQIHVHPSRHALLINHKSELEAVFPADVQCYIYANDDLETQECFIETNQGRVLVSVDSQLKELKLKLSHLLEGETE
ncbi:flagellar assembly protein FliH [Bacillus sp. KH172YL63]|uniref:flagellar assembly protein FliH n=1 Tax=Bacillus sp. KH172YL63 TaxID=2709784 RepID=UPI0013E4FDBD|nr:flagellar assembly protein FliH [Bacillus sp. KH172YL63]BCB03353.1 hypothetical protein KH172YL63_14860 [Bacillus sp. KH172YL63]